MQQYWERQIYFIETFFHDFNNALPWMVIIAVVLCLVFVRKSGKEKG